MAVLGELRQLEYLSFANSNVVELPREVEALTQLKLLDLQGCSDLQVIHANLFSRLCSLEALYMLNSFVRWNAKVNVCLVELENLNSLSTLEIQIPDPNMVPIGFKCFSQLRRYKISIAHLWDWKGEPERLRMLKLKVEAGVRFKGDTEFLLRETEDLYLDGVRGIDSMFYEGFPKLKHMHIENDNDIENLIKSTMAASHSAFPVLESLYLKHLRRLETICSTQLGIGSFGELQILKISNCDKLSSLFSFSALKCLQQLRELEVEFCENMKAVVGERNEDEHHNNEGIELTQLSSLKLSDLPHLTGFCKLEKGTEPMGVLFNTIISLPNLTSLVAERCKSLKHIFSPSMVKSLMQLKILEISACELVEEIIQSKKMEEIEEEEEEDRAEAVVFPNLGYLLLGSLEHVKWFSFCSSIEFPSLRELCIHHCSAMRNFVGRDSISESTEEYFFNEMVTFSNLETMCITGMNNIKYLWDEQFVTDDSFCKLKHVDVDDCSKLSVVFPSNICTRFQRVETLSLFRCGGVEHIYSGIDLKGVNYPFSLRELRLDYLRSLKHIWNMKSEWNKGSFSTFQNLQSVTVKGCEDLKWVFPASVGCGLPQLHQFQLARCDQLKVIIAKAKDDEGGINASFQFPKLKEMELMHMKEMRSLCEGGGSHSFNCPNLKSLKVLGCSNISLEKFFSNVEELMVDEQGFNAIHGYADVSAGFYFKLKRITLCSLNEETSIAAIFSVLNKHKYLDMLVFVSCSMEEIFRLHDPLDQRPTREEQHHCLRVKHLQLQYIETLNYITKEDSQFNHNLQTLHLDSCHDLMSITPSSNCLQNLMTLHVDYCRSMKNLVSASTAKTMVHLIEMKVVWCETIEEIVAKDEGGTEHNVMLIFNKLQRLELSRLPNLNSFCSDKDTLSFPLLEQVTIQNCPRMKSFCSGVVCTPKLQGILFENEQQWEGNLNVTITSQLRSWVGEYLEDGGRFHNLESLQVVNGTIASKAVLLANQMYLLNKLREITVRDCDSIQVVFDLEGLYAVEGYIGLLPKLKILELVNLPVMTRLCNKAPKGILDFNKLQVLEIDNCRKLPFVFTWSMASCLSQLRWVEVKNCEMMETFIMDEEDVTTKVTFNALENVLLESMPKFSSIYSGSGDLECLSLKWVTITECPSIKPMLISTQVHSTKQVFPKSVVLSLDMKSVRGMMQFEAPSDLFRILELRHWASTTTSHDLLVRFLSRLPNLGRLELCDSSFQEFLLFQSVSSVNSASSTASFQNLVTLTVNRCNQLINLITPSMAKGMVQLKHLKIEDCKMLMEIAGNGTDEAADDVIFTKLETLDLIDLQSLNAFSLTHHNFIFPCLDSVTIDRCPNLRIFCNGSVSTAMLNCVLDSEYCGIHYWEGNLNTTTECLYHKMVGFRGVEEIKLSAFPVLKEKWDAQFPTGFLTSLERLEVDNCELVLNAVASRLLKHLECLKVNCS